MKFAIFLSILTSVVLIRNTVEWSGRRDTEEKRSKSDRDNVNVPVVEQWVSSVVNFSSQSTYRSYGASRTIGEPNVYPRYGDLEGAWQQFQSGSTDIEWIIVQVKNPVCVTNVSVYETYHSGHVTMIEALSGCGFVSLWEAPNGVTPLSVSRIFSPTFQISSCVCSDTIKISTEPNGIGYVNIDAIKIVGEDNCSG